MIATLASALTLPRLGQVVDRHSVLKVTLFIVPMLAVAALLLALASHYLLLLFAIYLLRLFGQGMMVHSAYTAIARWFSAQRGRALASIILGHNAGDGLFPICFVTIAGGIGGEMAGSSRPARLSSSQRRPSRHSSRRLARRARPTRRRAVDARDWTRGAMVRDPLFYLAMLGVMALGFIVTSILFHQVYLVELRGWSMETFASSFILSAVVNTVFTLLSGQLIDRFSGVVLLPFVLLPLGIACLMLGGLEAQWAAFAFMAFLGFSNGLSTTRFGAVWPEI